MTEAEAQIKSALVVGSGLIGTSVALALRGHDVTVHLADRDPVAARRAADLGAGTLDPPTHQVDLAVVAVSPSATAEVVSGLVAGNVAATVMDTCGVKGSVVSEVTATVGEAGHFVATHPMAGRERSGPGAARADLFEGRPWAVSAGSADERSLGRVRALIELCGAVPVELDASAHDAAVALVSHAPHVAAALVAARLAEAGEPALALAGQGVRDVTRVASSDPALWVDVLAANAEPVATVLTALRKDLDAVIDALHTVGDDPAQARSSLREVLARGVDGRSRLPGKHGGRSTAYEIVPVVVADRPGELARLVVDVGATGVNIEDIRIEHSPGQPVGLVELAVAPGADTALAGALAALGWVVHGSGA